MKTIEQSPFTKYVRESNSDFSRMVSLDQPAERVFFTTARKFKGLESDVVILIDVDDKLFSSDEGRCLFYVGASRAKHFLNIAALLSPDEEDALSNSINADGKNARLCIMNGLKVVIANIDGL